MVPRRSDPADRLPRNVDAWCRNSLRARPVEVIFSAASMSRVFGLRLEDDRLAAIKLRPAEDRVFACADAQRVAAAAGVDCPRLLAGPSLLHQGATELATAEEWRPDGATQPVGTPEQPYAALARRLVAGLSGLDPARFAPPPPWLHYDHGSPSRTWAPARSAVWDPQGPASPVPEELRGFADRARRRLLAADLPEVVGHSDLNGLNVRWVSAGRGSVPIVHDWDSLAARPEAVLVGCVAVNHVELPQDGDIADLAGTEKLIQAYQTLRGTPFTAEEVEVAWAAGVWVACYNAAFEYLHGGPGKVCVRILTDAPQRLGRAGG